MVPQQSPPVQALLRPPTSSLVFRRRPPHFRPFSFLAFVPFFPSFRLCPPTSRSALSFLSPYQRTHAASPPHIATRRLLHIPRNNTHFQTFEKTRGLPNYAFFQNRDSPQQPHRQQHCQHHLSHPAATLPTRSHRHVHIMLDASLCSAPVSPTQRTRTYVKQHKNTSQPPPCLSSCRRAILDRWRPCHLLASTGCSAMHLLSQLLSAVQIHAIAH